MSYQFTLIQPTGYIGDDLPSVNTNYENFETLTLELVNSAKKYFDPLVNFYLFYGDFWKNTINFSESISAIPRLKNLTTLVTENSAKWISPLIFYYPAITKYDSNSLSNVKTNALEWFNSVYPITNLNGTVNFVENTKALIYCLLYEENLKINNLYQKIETTNCSTHDSSTAVNCWVTWNRNIACYDNKNACNRYDKTKAEYPTSPSCVRNFTMNCNYENNLKAITRYGIANVNSYFNDRSEKTELICIRLAVKNCEWVEIDVI
jgi:hypothetical protein